MGVLTPNTITISVVLYKNSPLHIKQLSDSLLSTSLPIDVFFIDHSPTDSLKRNIPKEKNFHYTWGKKNKGYGRGHNSIIEKFLDSGEYHLVINPDVYFKSGTLEKIVNFLDDREDIGLLLPRVLNPDGTEQPLFKLLPKPQDLFIRRFIPSILKTLFGKSQDLYQMSFADEKESFDAPYLSGCFMFMRKKCLKEVGLFDPRFFLYCEDVDLSRRIRAHSRTTYFSEASIHHYFNKGSYKSLKLLYYHVSSAIKYFNKYGWLNDIERDQINEETLKAFPKLKRVTSFYHAK